MLAVVLWGVASESDMILSIGELLQSSKMHGMMRPVLVDIIFV